jgi:beta-xylosidase
MLKNIIFVLLSFVLGKYAYAQQGNEEASNKVQQEDQPTADQHNGYYLNPIIPGNYGDPTIVRVDKDFYMAFSRGDGIIIWHSNDLVNWKPVVRHFLPEGYKQVWAIDIQYFNGLFHVYMPINFYPGKKEGTKGFGNFVITSKKPEGPWSTPIQIDIPVPQGIGHWGAIDPGFIQTQEGKKYLYISAGWVIELDASGTKSIGVPQKAYDGWEYPKEWNVQCKCLESPKLFYKDGFYYMVSAEGGTNGPSTAHMTVVARSKSATGPWENSPYNPLSHTYDEDEKWWHQGHGTIFNAADGSWWTVYHGRLKNYTGLGRSTLLMPVEWTKDGWPVIKNGYPSSALIPKLNYNNSGNGMQLSDDFSSPVMGMQWFYDYSKRDALQPGNRQLVMKASGKNHTDGTIITTGAVNKSFEVTIEIEMPLQGANAGIALDNDGITFDGTVAAFTEGPDWRLNEASKKPGTPGHIFFKIKNYRKDISLFYSDDGVQWISFGKGIRKEDSYRIKLFAAGNGNVVFKNFKYTGLE